MVLAYRIFKYLYSCSQQKGQPLDEFVKKIRDLLNMLPYNLDENVKLDLIYAYFNEATINDIPRNEIQSVEDLIKTCIAVEQTKDGSASNINIEEFGRQTQSFPSTSAGSGAIIDLCDEDEISTIVLSQVSDLEGEGSVLEDDASMERDASERDATNRDGSRKSKEVIPSSYKIDKKVYTSDKDKMKIIAAVYKHPILWKPDDKATSFKETISNTWIKLEKILEIDKLKQRWANLRTQYKNHIIRGIQTHLSEDIIKKMEFIKKYIVKKPGERVKKISTDSTAQDEQILRKKNRLDNHKTRKNPVSDKRARNTRKRSKHSLSTNVKENSKQLPIFEGNPVDWPAFKHSYVSTTVSQKLNRMQNIMRLKLHLGGVAKNVVEDLLHINSDPEKVVDLLEHTYGIPDVIWENTERKLKNILQKVRNKRGYENLASFINFKLSNPKKYDPALVNDLLEHLTPNQRHIFNEHELRNNGNKIGNLLTSQRLDLLENFLKSIPSNCSQSEAVASTSTAEHRIYY